jgi:hypothetical protein
MSLIFEVWSKVQKIKLSYLINELYEHNEVKIIVFITLVYDKCWNIYKTLEFNNNFQKKIYDFKVNHSESWSNFIRI